MRIRLIIIMCCLCIFTVFTAAAEPELKLAFGVYASDKPTTVVKQFRPLLNVLEKEMSKALGKKVKIKMTVTRTYEEGIKNLVEGKVDFARLGPVSYIRAKKQEPKLEILAIESRNGKKKFPGIICVVKNSTIKRVKQLKGKTFAFGDELSTIGRYLAQQYLLDNGIKYNDLKKYEYLGRHDKVGMAVAGGRFDAGALKESTFKKLVQEGQPLQRLASFKNVTKPWIAAGSMPGNVYRTLRRCLLAIKDPGALEALKKDGFLPGNDNDYDSIRRAIRRNPVFFGKKITPQHVD